MARVKFNPVTGRYEVQDAAAELQKKSEQILQQAISDPMSIQRQQQGQQFAAGPATTTTNTGQQPTDVTTKQVAGTETAQQPAQQPQVPQIDVDANDKARQEAIANQEAANAKEQTALQSGIDQYNAMVQGWQKERDELAAQQKAAEKDARVSMLISGIADGVASLANLYYTTKGAPNIQLYSGLDKYREIYEKARQRREGLQMQLNQRLQQGQLSLAQLRQQKAVAEAKGDAALGQAKANAALAKQQDITKNQQVQQEQARYEQGRADKEQARQDALAKDQRDFEYHKQKDAEDRQLRMQQMGLQYAYRQDALNQRREESKIRAFTSRNGEDVSLDIDGQLFNFGYKPLQKQFVSISETVYRDAKAGMQSRIDEINKLVNKKGKPEKGAGVSQEQAAMLAEERSQLQTRLYGLDPEWENAKNGNTREVFASTYLNYSTAAKESLKRMSHNYERERNAAYGIADAADDDQDDENTPPSKRKSKQDKDDDNTPPSMRK